MSEILFCRLKNDDGPLSKRFARKDGTLVKKAAADLVRGTATQAAVRSIHELAAIIESLGTNEAATWGIPGFRSVRVCTDDAAKRGRNGAIARTKKNWSWPEGRAVLMIDQDTPKDGSRPLKSVQLDAILCDALPWWKGVARMYRPGASAFIYDEKTGAELSGHGSLRCYCIVDHGPNIPFVGLAIADAFWRHGYGRIEFSGSGSALLRCPADMSVWSEERLDFCGRAVIGKGLIQKRKDPRIIDGGDIDSETVIAAGPGKVTYSQWKVKSRESASGSQVRSTRREAAPYRLCRDARRKGRCRGHR